MKIIKLEKNIALIEHDWADGSVDYSTCLFYNINNTSFGNYVKNIQAATRDFEERIKRR